MPHKTEPPHRYCDRCGGPFAGDRRSFGSVIHLAVDCEIDGSAVRYNNLALVVRTRLRCPWISGPRLWPATSQSVHRRRIVDGLPSDGVPRESSVHRYPCDERGTNILRQRERSNQGIPDSSAVLACSPRRGARLHVDLISPTYQYTQTTQFDIQPHRAYVADMQLARVTHHHALHHHGPTGRGDARMRMIR